MFKFKTGLLALMLITIGAFTAPNIQAASCGNVGTPSACTATVGGLTLTFDNFSFLSALSGVGTGTQVASSQVNINTVTNPYSVDVNFTPNPGPTFGGIMTGSQLQQLFVSYKVSLTGTGSITNIMSAFSDMFTGTGSGSQTKDVCTGGPCGGGGTTVSTINLNDSGGTTGVQGFYSGSTNPTFGSTSPSSFWVKDTVSMQANSSGTDKVYSFSNSYGTAVPEPGTYALLGAGLIGIAALRRRHQKN